MMRNQRKSFSSCTPDELDSAGLFPASGETPEAFAERIARLEQELDGISADRAFQVLIADSPEIPSALREEAENLTWEKFRFRAGWVPAWYSAARTGFLSAGILLEADGCSRSFFCTAVSSANGAGWDTTPPKRSRMR